MYRHSVRTKEYQGLRKPAIHTVQFRLWLYFISAL